MEDKIDLFQRFNPTFQAKSIAAMITDVAFLEQTYDIVNPLYFESEANQWIIKSTIWYFENYKKSPTLEVFKKELDKFVGDAPKGNTALLRIAIIEQLKEIWSYLGASDLQYVKEEFINFCRNQALKNAILESADLAAVGDYEQIRGRIDKAMSAGQDRNFGHNWHLDIEQRLEKESRNTIPTPWTAINEVMDGGLGAGEMGCVMAPSGVGKSWMLRAISLHAMKLGYNVVDFTLELSERYTGNRYDTILTGIPANQIHHGNNIELVRKAVSDIKGNLQIKYFPVRAASVATIRAALNRLMASGFTPDLIVLDYADLLRSIEKSNAKHEELGYIFEEFRGMLGELQIPGWTVTQSQRSSLSENVIEGDKIAGAYSKIMPCDFFASVSRMLQDKVSNTGRFHVIKNRFGPDGLTYPMEMNLQHGIIDIYDEHSPKGQALRDLMNSGSSGNVHVAIRDKFKNATNPQSDTPQWFEDKKE